MNKIATMAGLAWKAAFRYRLFWILCGLLAAAVVGLPLLVKDDGTAKGMVQILMTYTLSTTAALLGLATLWLSCGTLAKDVEECQVQMVAVKPIARWQIWLGKWLGLLCLDAVLLALAGTGIFFMLQWRAGHLPPDQQKILREDIFVSRASAKEPIPNLSSNIDFYTRKAIPSISEAVGDNPQERQRQILEKRRQITESLIARLTVLPLGTVKMWAIDMHSKLDQLRDKPLQLRIKFLTSNPSEEVQYTTLWRIGAPNSTRAWTNSETFPANSFQEFTIPPNLLDDKGRLWIEVANPYENRLDLTFPLGEGVELLYPESTFGVNFIRGLAVIFCGLVLLASIGLAAASFLSFPVAAFVSVAVLIMGLSSGIVSTVVEQGTVAGFDNVNGGFRHTIIDYAVVPLFQGALKIINLVQSFSPIDALSSGRSITWGTLALAVAQIIVLLSGFFCLVGIILFTRRELATAQGNS